MSKYIIEIEDVPFSKVHIDADGAQNINLYRVKGFSALVFDEHGLDKLTPFDKELEEAYQKGLEEGKKQAKVQAHLDVCHDIERVAHGNYQKGLDDAWVAAKKICTNWMISDQTLAEIFGQCKDIDTIMHENTAQEAINKIQAYEQQKADAEIKVGDWVFNKHVGRTSSAKATCVDGQKVYMLCGDGSCEFADITDLEKTNASNPKIEQLLEMLKGKQRDCHTCKHQVASSIECVDCRGFGKWGPKEGE